MQQYAELSLRADCQFPQPLERQMPYLYAMTFCWFVVCVLASVLSIYMGW